MQAMLSRKKITQWRCKLKVVYKHILSIPLSFLIDEMYHLFIFFLIFFFLKSRLKSVSLRDVCILHLLSSNNWDPWEIIIRHLMCVATNQQSICSIAETKLHSQGEMFTFTWRNCTEVYFQFVILWLLWIFAQSFDRLDFPFCPTRLMLSKHPVTLDNCTLGN